MKEPPDIEHRERLPSVPPVDGDQIRSLLDSMEDVIFSVDEEGRFLYVSPSAERRYGYRVAELIGRPFFELVHPDDLPGLLEAFRESLTGVVRPHVFRGFDAAGRLRHVRTLGRVQMVDGRPSGITGVMVDVTELELAQAELRTSEARTRALFEMFPLPTFVFRRGGPEFVLSEVNAAAIGLTEGGVIGKVGRTAREMLQARPDLIEDMERCFATRAQFDREIEFTFAATGRKRLLHSTYGYLPPDSVVVYTEDVTKRRATEEQLLLSQKMEAIGRLAGGIAHDFNNLLTVIDSYATFALEDLPEGTPVREDISEIRGAAKRATSLTRQMLAFGRRQVLVPEVIDLSRVVAGLEDMLRRLIGEDIALRVSHAAGTGMVKADPGQVEQVIMNLAVNARDAMPEGGRLTIETANVTLDDGYAAKHVAVSPGEYVQLSVSDTGCGMDEETRRQAFEPFFTTKPKGKGTGLGLSTVYGIVKQSGGNVWIYSEPGRGTTVKVYLPRADEPLTIQRSSRPAPATLSGSETILLVEDEETVRRITERMLSSAGYRVVAAADGAEAILAFNRLDRPPDLVLTDVVMPVMGGKELADNLAALCPKVRVLFMSGYTDDAIVHHGILNPGTAFIAKPFSALALARKVREVLDS